MKFFIVLGALCFIQLGIAHGSRSCKSSSSSSSSSEEVDPAVRETLKCVKKYSKELSKEAKDSEKEIKKCLKNDQLTADVAAKIDALKPAIKVVADNSHKVHKSKDKIKDLEKLENSIDLALPLVEDVLNSKASACIKKTVNRLKVMLQAIKKCLPELRNDKVVPV